MGSPMTVDRAALRKGFPSGVCLKESLSQKCIQRLNQPPATRARHSDPALQPRSQALKQVCVCSPQGILARTRPVCINYVDAPIAPLQKKISQGIVQVLLCSSLHADCCPGFFPQDKCPLHGHREQDGHPKGANKPPPIWHPRRLSDLSRDAIRDVHDLLGTPYICCGSKREQ